MLLSVGYHFSWEGMELHQIRLGHDAWFSFGLHRTLEHIYQTFASFQKLVACNNNRRALGYVFVKCKYNDAASMPRSLVFRQGQRDGNGWNKAVRVNILNWKHSEIDEIPPARYPHTLPPPSEPCGGSTGRRHGRSGAACRMLGFDSRGLTNSNNGVTKTANSRTRHVARGTEILVNPQPPRVGCL
jgi:hypothetical protein